MTRSSARRTRSAGASSRPSTPTSRSPTRASDLVCQDTGIAVYYVRVGEQLPAPPGPHRGGPARGHPAGDARPSAALEHRSHPDPKADRRQHRPPHPPRPLGVRARLGRARHEVRAEGVRLREHELPEDARPGRRREGDQARSCSTRSSAPAGSPARRASSGVGIGGSADLAMYLAKEAIARPVGHAQPGSRRRRARARPLRAPERDRRRPDGPRRRHHGALGARRAGPHAHHPEPGRRQLPVLGRAPGDGARLGRRRRRAGPGR